jgi:hypothetical protein
MVKLDVVALVATIGTSVGVFLTAILNFLHGRDDARGLEKYVGILERESQQSSQRMSEAATMLNEHLTKVTTMLEKIVMRKRQS